MAASVDAVLHFSASAGAAALARELGVPCLPVESHRFPDGEMRLRLPVPMPRRAAIYASLDHPNEKLVALLIAARGSRELGAERLALVAPYLCYMRQDMAFTPGEPVSQRIVGRFLADLFDDVITVDPHLHRIETLDEAVPAGRAVALSAALAIGRFVASQVPEPLLVGPDAESAQWVEAAAAAAGAPFAVCEKRRLGDRDVEIDMPAVPLAGRSVVLLDDMASTGRTLARAARIALGAGAASVDVAVTHPLFVGDAVEELRLAGVRHVWSTDSVEHPTNRIALAPLLASALR